MEINLLGIGGKAVPAGLVLNGIPNEGLNVAQMDMGDLYRMLVNKVEA